jgi:hypothetical protein
MEVLVIAHQREKVLTPVALLQDLKFPNNLKVQSTPMQLIKSTVEPSVNLLIHSSRLSNELPPAGTQLPHLLLNTQHLPTLKNTLKPLLSSLHRHPLSTSSVKELHSTQSNKIPRMALRFPLKAHSVKKNMKLIRKVTSSLMPTETRSVTRDQALTQTQTNMMSQLRGSVRLQICNDMVKSLELSMEADPLQLLDVLQPATQQLESLWTIPANRMVQVLLNGQLCPAITTRHDCPTYWRRMSEVEQALVKLAAPASDLH